MKRKITRLARGLKCGGFGAYGFRPAVAALQARANAQAQDLAPIIKDLQAAGKTTLRAIAEGLNEQSIPTVRGGQWSSPQVMRMLERLDPFREEEAQAA